jgi:ribose transport system substrate-binding protein
VIHGFTIRYPFNELHFLLLGTFVMKAYLNVVAAATFATAILAPLIGFAQQDKITIGLAAANLDADFFNQIKQSVEAHANKKGIKIITVDARGDSAIQLNQIKELLARKIDALIYIPAGANAAGVPVQAARAAGVPVVAVDRNAPDAPGDTFIATDSVSAARTLGEYVVKSTEGKGEVAIIQGQLGTTPELDRDKGFTEALANAPDMKVVAKQDSKAWHQDEGFAIARAMLKRNPGITVLFGRADALALGAARAVKAASLDHKVMIVGFDGDITGLKAVKSGVLAATMTQQTQLMGRTSLDAALDLIAGKKLPPVQLLPAALTTKDNVDGYIAEHP